MTFYRGYRTIEVMKFGIILVILGLTFGGFFVDPIEVFAGSAACGFNPDTNNFNPIAGIQVKPRQFVFQGRDVSGEPIKVGTSVNIDATPVDSAQRPTNTRDPNQEPKWSILGPGRFLTGRPTDQCFLPRVDVTGEGEIIVTVTMGTINGTTAFSVGGTMTNLNPGGSGGGGGDVEKGEYCAYKNTDSKYYCIPGSQDIKDAAECNTDVFPCNTTEFKSKGNTCERKKFPDQCTTDNPKWTGMPADAPAPQLPRQQARDIGQLIADVFNWSLTILGISVFVMIIYGGATWLVAAGSPSLVGKAKDTIKNALLGAVLLLSAYLVLNTINPDFVQQSFILPAIKTGTQTNPSTLPVNQTQPAGKEGGACVNNNCDGQLVCVNGTCRVSGDPGKLYGQCLNNVCDGQLKCVNNICQP